MVAELESNSSSLLSVSFPHAMATEGSPTPGKKRPPPASPSSPSIQWPRVSFDGQPIVGGMEATYDRAQDHPFVKATLEAMRQVMLHLGNYHEVINQHAKMHENHHYNICHHASEAVKQLKYRVSTLEVGRCDEPNKIGKDLAPTRSVMLDLDKEVENMKRSIGSAVKDMKQEIERNCATNVSLEQVRNKTLNVESKTKDAFEKITGEIEAKIEQMDSFDMKVKQAIEKTLNESDKGQGIVHMLSEGLSAQAEPTTHLQDDLRQSAEQLTELTMQLSGWQQRRSNVDTQQRHSKLVSEISFLKQSQREHSGMGLQPGVFGIATPFGMKQEVPPPVDHWVE